MLTETPASRAIIGEYVEIYEYPDGRIEVRSKGYALAYRLYDKLYDIDQGEIVENKRLGHVLQIAQLVQSKRDNRRRNIPSRTKVNGSLKMTQWGCGQNLGLLWR